MVFIGLEEEEAENEEIALTIYKFAIQAVRSKHAVTTAKMAKKKSKAAALEDPQATERLLSNASESPASSPISSSHLFHAVLQTNPLASPATDTNSHGDYEELPIESSPVLVRRQRRARKVWCAIIALSAGILLFLGVLAILRAVQDANSLVPTKLPAFPTQYEASITVNMPYIGLVEPIYVHVDEAQGLQRLSYYGDTDVFIFNTTGLSYQIIPVIREQKCFVADPEPLQHVFPNMSLFEPQHGLTSIAGRPCLSWKFVTKRDEPTVDGLLGEYTLYVDQEHEQPVRFHYVGRNAMLGGSHIDEYFIDYNYVRAGPVSVHVFSSLPSRMNCTRMGGSEGPTHMPRLDVRRL